MKSKRERKKKGKNKGLMAFFIRPAPLHMREGIDQTATSKTQEDFFILVTNLILSNQGFRLLIT